MKARKLSDLLLIAPLVLFLCVTFIAPLARMLFLAVDDRELATIMSRTAAVLAAWDRLGVPSSDAYAAVGLDLMDARENRMVGSPARRLGYEDTNFQLIFQDTARALPREVYDDTNWQAILVEIDPAWEESDIWLAIANAQGPLTDLHLRTALGLRGGEQVTFYATVLLRTVVIALSTTLICVFLAVPSGYLMATVRFRTASFLMLALLLPLWTSIIIRSMAWLVVLQKNGIVNQLLRLMHITDMPLELIYNRTGVLISLTHVLLPYAILPVYASIKILPHTQMQAAYSLGAGPCRAFFRIYLPQIMPGISAGGLLVFILALGYYITPLLLGGAGDQMLPYYIVYNTLQTLNWGLAAALAVLMLFATVMLYIIYVRLAGIERVGV